MILFRRSKKGDYEVILDNIDRLEYELGFKPARERVVPESFTAAIAAGRWKTATAAKAQNYAAGVSELGRP